jgi:hypothetical protein
VIFSPKDKRAYVILFDFGTAKPIEQISCPSPSFFVQTIHTLKLLPNFDPE